MGYGTPYHGRWALKGLCAVALLSTAAVLWYVDTQPGPLTEPPAMPVQSPNAAVDLLTVPAEERAVDPPVPKNPPASLSFPYTAEQRWLHNGQTVVRLASTSRVIDVREGDVVDGTYLVRSSPSHITFVHLVTGTTHAVDLPIDCQEMRQPPDALPSPITTAQGSPQRVASHSSPAIMDAEQTAQED